MKTLKPRRQFLRTTSGLFVPMLLLPRRTLAQALTLNDPAQAVQSSGGAAAVLTALTISGLGPSHFGGGGWSQYGFEFTTSVTIKVTKLGRWKRTGNTSTVTMAIWNSSGGSKLSSDLSLNLTTADTEAMNYVAFGSPFSLSAGTYNVWTAYQNAGAADDFYDAPTVSATDSHISSVFSSEITGAGFATSAANSSNGPMNMLFTL